VAISPDGATMAYSANAALWLRSMGELQPRTIVGTSARTGPTSLVFSPDGRSLAYWASDDRTIKQIPTVGGTPVTICAADGQIGMSWSGDTILFGLIGKGIMRVPASGGVPETLVPLAASLYGYGPQMLPGNRAVLFTLSDSASWDNARIVVQPLDGGPRKTLVERANDARFVPTGHLVYVHSGVLFAIAFDVNRLETHGQPVPVVEGVQRAVLNSSATAHFAFSDSGTLLFIPGPAATSNTSLDLAVFDVASGNGVPLKLPPQVYTYPRVSRDGKHVAVGTDDGMTAQIWVYDLAGTSAIRQLTFDGKNRFPIWSPDGTRIAFQSDRDGDAAIFAQRADGTGKAERLTRPERDISHVPEVWSGDDLVFAVVKGRNYTLAALSTREGKVRSLGDVRSFSPPAATMSPDGKWLAYMAQSEGDLPRIIVRPYPSLDGQYSITNNAIQPLWSADGKELYFSPRGQLAYSSITTQPSFSFTPPVTARRGFRVRGPAYEREFDAMPTGRRLIGVTSPADASGVLQDPAVVNARLDVVLNWFEELKARVPAK